MYAFEFVRPTTVDEAVKALGAEEAQALGGGQTLIPTLKQRLASPGTLVSLAGIASLKGVAMRDGKLCIGGGTTHSQVMREAKAHYPALAEMASWIGDPAVRNRGTIGGSLANNDPSACYPAAALASGATIVTNTREIAADDYFQGMFTTALEDGEIITEVRFPIPEQANYQKFRQPASRFALVGRLRGEVPGRGPGRGDGRVGERGVPLERGGGGAVERLPGGGGQGAEGERRGADRGPARDAGVPGAPDRGADGAGGGSGAGRLGAGGVAPGAAFRRGPPLRP